MKKKCILSLLFFLILTIGSSDGSDIDNEIREVLIKQRAAWNRGDIEGFMVYYWKSEELSFQSGNKRIIGWDALLARYKGNYSKDSMGTFSFTDIMINILSEEFVLVLGRWEVKGKDETVGGLFTLVFQPKPEGWRIIHDHTSS